MLSYLFPAVVITNVYAKLLIWLSLTKVVILPFKSVMNWSIIFPSRLTVIEMLGTPLKLAKNKPYTANRGLTVKFLMNFTVVSYN